MRWRRLYIQIYLTSVASLVLVVVLSSLLWVTIARDRFDRDIFDIVGRLAYISLPAATASVDEQQATVMRFSRELGIEISLFDKARRLIASSGNAPSHLPDEDEDHHDDDGWHKIHEDHGWVLRLPDDRWLAVDLGRERRHRPLTGITILLGIVALGVGLGAYPFVRRLTRRLEDLQKGVERIGAGDLSARVDVQGRDEVADLAAGFNDAAEQIENLIGAHRLLLANASHELRTPYRESAWAWNCCRRAATRTAVRRCSRTSPNWMN